MNYLHQSFALGQNVERTFFLLFVKSFCSYIEIWKMGRAANFALWVC